MSDQSRGEALLKRHAWFVFVSSDIFMLGIGLGCISYCILNPSPNDRPDFWQPGNIGGTLLGIGLATGVLALFVAPLKLHRPYPLYPIKLLLCLVYAMQLIYLSLAF